MKWWLVLRGWPVNHDDLGGIARRTGCLTLNHSYRFLRYEYLYAINARILGKIVQCWAIVIYEGY